MLHQSTSLKNILQAKKKKENPLGVQLLTRQRLTI